MIGYLLRQFMMGLVSGMRVVRSFFMRIFMNIWARARRVTQVARGTSLAMNKATKSISQVGQKPSKRDDFIELKTMYIAKHFLLRALVLLIVGVALSYFIIYPLMMRYFFTAHLYSHDSKLSDYTGDVVVYYDVDKEVPYYEGHLEDGKLQGEGKRYDKDGLLEYEGGFVDGLRSGYGEEYEKGQLIYRGEFLFGEYSGDGEQYEEGRLVYSGTYEDGRLNGTDCYAYYPNGRPSYRGEYTHGEQTGTGIAFYESGVQQYAGDFVRGKWDGSGTEYDEDGAIVYNGGFQNNIYEGSGTLYLDNSFRMDGSFTSGVQGGDVTVTKAGIAYYTGGASEGVLNGQGQVLDKLGNILYDGTMRGGTIDGSVLLGKTLDEVTEALSGVRLTREDLREAILLTSEELGLSVYFSYNITEDTVPTAYDVCLCRTENLSKELEQLLWSFTDDIDAWRDTMWPNASMVAGKTIPQYAAAAYGKKSYPCVIYADGYGSCTIWSDSGRCFMLQWTTSVGQVASVKDDAYVAPLEIPLKE